jgi:hypothetical protein
MPDNLEAPAGVTIMPPSRPASRPPPPTREISVADLERMPSRARTPSRPASVPVPKEADLPQTRTRPAVADALRPGAEDPPAAPVPRKPSARDRFHEAADKSAGEPAADQIVPRPGDSENPSGQTPDGEVTPPETPPEPGIVPQPNAVDPKTGKRPNPWHLLKAEKEARAAAEAEVQRVKSGVVPEQERTALTARVEKAEARAKELEDHIRYVDYEKSTEFKEKFDAPYVASWERAMSELSEITVTDPGTGQPRAVTADDLVKLANMPLQAAQDASDELFGKFASYAMTHRAEIKKMSAARAQALKDAREQGAQRETQTREQQTKQLTESVKFTRDTFKEINSAILADPKIGVDFQPIVPPEGQQLSAEETEWNDTLAAGYKLVDDGWAANPTAPNLTEDQRKMIIARHAAIRNRAAGWKPLKLKLRRVEKALAAAHKELEQYRESIPAAGGSVPSSRNGNGRPASARDSMWSNVERRMKVR